MAGLAARVGYKAFSHVMLEGEMSYDFKQAFTEQCLSPSCTVTWQTATSKSYMASLARKLLAVTVRFALS